MEMVKGVGIVRTRTAWRRARVRCLRVGDTLVRNVQRGMEWVPGPYGAFVVTTIVVRGDEFVITAVAASGCGGSISVNYDGDERVTVSRKTRL